MTDRSRTLKDQGKITLENLKKTINQLITELAVNNNYEGIEHFLPSIKNKSNFEDFLSKDKIKDILNNGSYQALSNLAVSNLSLCKYISSISESSLNENSKKTFNKLKKAILVDLTVNNNYKSLEHLLLSITIESLENFENFLPNEKLIDSLNNGSYQALSKLISINLSLCRYISRMQNDSLSLNKNGQETLEELKKVILVDLVIKNNHEDLKCFLPSIKALEWFENFLPKEKLADSLNNGSYQVLSKLVETNQSLNQYISNIQNDSSLTKKGQGTLKKLRQYIDENPINFPKGSREIPNETFQKMVEDEAREEASNLYAQNTEQPCLFPNVRYCPTTPFDNHQSFMEKQLLSRYSSSTNRHSFYPNPDPDEPDFSDIEYMPGGPNYS